MSELKGVVIGNRKKNDVQFQLRIGKNLAAQLTQMSVGGVLKISEDQFISAIHSVADERDGKEQAQQSDILSVAKEIIYGDREKAYGSPRFNLDSIAQLWSVYLSRKFPENQASFEASPHLNITAEDVCQMMILLKTARLIHNPVHIDSLVDQAGYAALQERIQPF